MAYCNNCGNQINAENKFCAKCGQALHNGAVSVQQEQVTAEPSESGYNDSADKNREWLFKNKWKLIGGLAALFLVYYVYNNFISINPEKKAKKMAAASCSIAEKKFDSLKTVYRSFVNDIKTKDTFVTKFKLDSLKNSIEQSFQAKSSENIDNYNKQFDKYKDADDKELFEISYREEMRNCGKMPRELEKLQSEAENAMYSSSSSSSSYGSSSTYDRPTTTTDYSKADAAKAVTMDAPATASPSLSSSNYGSSSSSSSSSYGSSNSYYTPDVVVKNYLSSISSGNSVEAAYYSYLYKCTNYFGAATPTMQTIVDALAPFKKKAYSATIKYRNVSVVKNGTVNEVAVDFDYYYFDTKDKKYKLKTNQKVNVKLDANNSITEISGSQFD